MSSVYNWLRARPALIGFLILAVGLAFAFSAASTADKNANIALKRDVKREVAVNSCQRVNLLRAQSNVSNDVSWTVLSVSTQRELALAQKGSQQRSIHKRSAMLLDRQAHRLDVTPLTDCAKAVAVDRSHPYFFPGAHEIGNPATGVKDTEAQRTVHASEHFIASIPRDTR